MCSSSSADPIPTGDSSPSALILFQTAPSWSSLQRMRMRFNSGNQPPLMLSPPPWFPRQIHNSRNRLTANASVNSSGCPVPNQASSQKSPSSLIKTSRVFSFAYPHKRRTRLPFRQDLCLLPPRSGPGASGLSQIKVTWSSQPPIPSGISAGYHHVQLKGCALHFLDCKYIM